MKPSKIEAEIGRVIVQGPLSSSGVPLVDVEAILTPTTDGRWHVAILGGRYAARRFDVFEVGLAWAFQRVRDRAGRALNGRVPRGTSSQVKAPRTRAD